jgi:DNA-binding CsgD family transcriptional regulator
MDSLDDLQSQKALKNHPTVEPDVLRILENDELKAELRANQGPLTPREKQLLELHLEGYKCDEIADRLNEDVRLIRADLNAVRNKVHQRIKRRSKPPKY